MQPEATLALVVSSAIFALTIILVVAILVTARNRLRELERHFVPLSHTLPPDGIRVPIRAAFLGRKATGMLSLGNNSLNPLLILHEDQVEYRVFFRRTRPLSEIDLVEVYGFARHVRLTFENGSTFSAFVPNPDARRELLAFFARKGVALGERASALLTP